MDYRYGRIAIILLHLCSIDHVTLGIGETENLVIAYAWIDYQIDSVSSTWPWYLFLQNIVEILCYV